MPIFTGGGGGVGGGVGGGGGGGGVAWRTFGVPGHAWRFDFRRQGHCLRGLTGFVGISLSLSISLFFSFSLSCAPLCYLLPFVRYFSGYSTDPISTGVYLVSLAVRICCLFLFNPLVTGAPFVFTCFVCRLCLGPSLTRPVFTLGRPVGFCLV